ncbi:MAG: response regulator [Actinobacteria bacterium]|nr:response regulator [Actinomycetota bacterium]
MTRVLIVDDERPLVRALAMNLSARGYEVVEADTAGHALTATAQQEPDVILLDLGLPDLGGLDVIRGVRHYSQVPIIVISARTGSADKVSALDLGADDYVTKPFSIDELLARVRAATRRAGVSDAITTVTVGTARVDVLAKTVTGAGGQRIHLTPTEWHLLELLIRHPGRLVTSRALLTELRGAPEHTDPSYLRIYMAQLRRKLEPEPSRPQHLITEPGMGYRFQP